MKIKNRILCILVIFIFLTGTFLFSVSAGLMPENDVGTKQETNKTETAKETEPLTKPETEPATKEETEPATEKKMERASEKQTLAQTDTEEGQGVALTSPYDLEFVSLVPDENFRIAIYNSLEEYEWLKGDLIKPPQSIQEILETYTGPIKASGEGKYDGQKIRSIEGIQYLKIATTASTNYWIDLHSNEIEDITPLTKNCNEENYYYGYLHRNSSLDVDGGAVQVDFRHNPLRCIPKTYNTSTKVKFGFLRLGSMTGSDYSYQENINYYYLRKTTEQFGSVIRVGYCQYDSREPRAEYVPVTDISAYTLESDDPQFIDAQMIENGPHGRKNVDAEFFGLAKSGKLHISVSLDKCMRVVGVNKSGAITSDTTSMGYSFSPFIRIFDKVSVNAQSPGAAQLKKVAEDTGNPVNGAVYSLYRREADGSGTLVKEGLTTATRKVRVYNNESGAYEEQELPGYTEEVQGLNPGTYYFQETEAPVGYRLDTAEIEVKVKNYIANISGGEKVLDYTSYDETKLNAQAKENETFVSQGIKKPIQFYLVDEDKNEFDDGFADRIIEEVKVTYSSLNQSGTPVVKSYATISEAENKMAEYISANQITGAVEVTIVYDKDNGQFLNQVTAVDEPVYTQVKVLKNWVGLAGTEILPEVTFRIFREVEDVLEKKEVNAWVVPAGAEKGDYSHTFDKDAEGHKLNLYYTDQTGTTYPYVYSMEEEFHSEDYVPGKPGKAQRLVYETVEDGISKEEVFITLPVSNYKKASIKLIKVDADDNARKLENVVFKLEVKKEGHYVEVDSLKTNERGEVLFRSLDSGEYRITEMETQGGYVLLEKPIDVTIGDLGNDEWTDREIEYTVENHRSYELPATGGIGKWVYLCIGACGIGVSGMQLIKKRKVRKVRQRL